jgi:hypothetical protein
MTPPAMDAAGFGAAFAENPARGGGFWIVAAGIGRYPPAAKKSRAARVGGSKPRRACRRIVVRLDQMP